VTYHLVSQALRAEDRTKRKREERLMFTPKRVGAALPAQDLERAKSFYADKLGLKPTSETSDEALYDIEGSRFGVFKTFGKPSGDHTQMAIDVDDVKDAVKSLRENGIVFEEYDMPGFKSVDGIVELEGEKGAWFKDSEGNLIAIAQRT
jgi:catechol 2,3-dioxygenase-like lactoylglutathione lyase family enzyme